MENSFGAALRTLRQDLGLSQLALATAISTTQRHVSFLETGRSRPSKDFVVRISTDLSVSLPQRAMLFDAAGFTNPYRNQSFGDQELSALLDTIEARALAHWPYPGFLLDREWTVLRMNAPAEGLLAGFDLPKDAPPSMFEVFLSPQFRERVENWQEVSTVFYFRMQAACAHSSLLAARFAQARADGLFDHMPGRLSADMDVPPYIPVIFAGPGGQRLSMSSFVGKLASIHDAAVEGLEIELLIPVDAATEACLLGHPPAPGS